MTAVELIPLEEIVAARRRVVGMVTDLGLEMLRRGPPHRLRKTLITSWVPQQESQQSLQGLVEDSAMGASRL